MGLSDISSETHSQHAEMRKGQNLDLLRLIAEGKRPASQEENERPVGENGKPLEKLQLAPERDILGGGMPRWWGCGDQASTSTGRRGDQASTGTRVEDLARMSPSEQVKWCVRGGLAEAFGPDGNRTLHPVIMDIISNNKINSSVRGDIIKEIVALQPEKGFLHEIAHILKNDPNFHIVQEAIVKKAVAASPGIEAVRQMMPFLGDNRIDRRMIISIVKDVVASQPEAEAFRQMMQILKYDMNIKYGKSINIVQETIVKEIVASHPETEILREMMQMIRTNQIITSIGKTIVKEIIHSQPEAEVFREMVQIRSNRQIDGDVRNEIDRMLITLNTVLTTSSSEASSSHRAGPSRSSEQREGMRQGIRSGEESSRQREQWIEQMSMILEEHSQITEREKQLKQEAEQRLQRELRIQKETIRRDEQQKFQQERDRFRRQLRGAQQERDQARGQLRGAQQERDQARGQLREAQQEHDQAQTQLRNVQQEHQEQIRQAQQERDQARRQLEEMRQFLQDEQNRGSMWNNRLIDTFWSWIGNTEREPQQDERGQSSRGEMRANNTLPTTREGLQEQLERERRTPQESRERVQQLRERIQRRIWEQGAQPPNERLNELLKYPIEGILEDHHLVEEIYPLNHQPEQDRQALRQSFHNALRKRLKDLYVTALVEYRPSGLQEHEIAGEFLNQLQEQMEERHRPNQEWVDASEDILQEVTGNRPRR